MSSTSGDSKTSYSGGSPTAGSYSSATTRQTASSGDYDGAYQPYGTTEPGKQTAGEDFKVSRDWGSAEYGIRDSSYEPAKNSNDFGGVEPSKRSVFKR